MHAFPQTAPGSTSLRSSTSSTASRPSRRLATRSMRWSQAYSPLIIHSSSRRNRRNEQPQVSTEKRPLGANYLRLWLASIVSNFGDGLATVAYPWLASSVTRSPLHLAGIAIATRLPWALFSLPAGVITDRVDRRRLIGSMDALRFGLTLTVGVIVGIGASQFPDPTDLAAGIGRSTFVRVLVSDHALLVCAPVRYGRGVARQRSADIDAVRSGQGPTRTCQRSSLGRGDGDEQLRRSLRQRGCSSPSPWPFPSTSTRSRSSYRPS